MLVVQARFCFGMPDCKCIGLSWFSSCGLCNGIFGRERQGICKVHMVLKKEVVADKDLCLEFFTMDADQCFFSSLFENVY